MAYEDKTIQCADCGANFTFTCQEQEFFASKGYVNEPKRCSACRQVRKNERGGGSRANRQTFPATCAQCGQATELPFEPKQGRPVYCRDCFAQQTPR